MYTHVVKVSVQRRGHRFKGKCRGLGAKGWGPVHHFPSFDPAGSREHGRVLSPKALDALFRSLKAAEFSSSTPGILLTDRGGIGLCWEHRQGNSVQVEFTGTSAEFYHAATEEEGVVAFD